MDQKSKHPLSFRAVVFNLGSIEPQEFDDIVSGIQRVGSMDLCEIHVLLILFNERNDFSQ